MIEGRYDITVVKGKTLEVVFTFDIDITGMVFSGGLYRDNQTNDGVQAFTITKDNGAKTVTLSLSYTQTSGLAEGTYRYELNAESSGKRFTYVAGVVIVKQGFPQ